MSAILLASRKHRARRARSTHRPRPRHCGWQFEALEDRCLLSGPSTDAPAPEGYEPFANHWDLQSQLIDQAVRNWQSLLGQPYHDWGWPFSRWGSFFSGTAEVTTLAQAAPDHTETNVQVAGVDEADFVKTDGEYAYIVSGSSLAVVDVWPGDAVEVVARYELPGLARAEYLTGSRLTVIADNFGGASWDEPADPEAPWDYAGLQVLVFDVSDPTTPVVLEATALDSSYAGSRMIGDNLYLLGRSHVSALPPEILGDESGQQTYETEQQYRERLWSLDVNDWLPQFVTRTHDAGGAHDVFASLHRPNQIHRLPSSGMESLLSVVVFNVADEIGGPVDSVATPVDSYSILYASVDNLYIAQNNGFGWHSEIIKFHLSEDNVALTAAGTVPGNVLNQFSIDEYQGHLRVATNALRGFERVNNVYVLGEVSGGRLEIVGSVEGLAPGELIYSVRFLGERGYVVTFRTVDPLFVLDLSDPGIPTVAGELKIPGFSSYLQPIDSHRMIGIGRAADERTGLFQEVQVSLFDVADPEQPILLSRYSFEAGRYGQSEATSDHHAVGYYPESHLLAIPFIDGLSFSGTDPYRLRLLRVDAGTLQPVVANIGWSQPLRRTFRVENVLYVVGDQRLEAYRMHDYSAPISAVTFAEPGTRWYRRPGVEWGVIGIARTFASSTSEHSPAAVGTVGLPGLQPLRWGILAGSSSRLRAAESQSASFAGFGISLAVAEGTTHLAVGMASASRWDSAPQTAETASSTGDALARSRVDSVLSRPRRTGGGPAESAVENDAAEQNSAHLPAPGDATLDPLFESWAESLVDQFDTLFDVLWESTSYEGQP